MNKKLTHQSHIFIANPKPNPTSNMVTFAVLRIERRTKPAIILRINKNGYIYRAGDRLCKQVKLLLEKYSIKEIETMLDALELEKYTDKKVQDFKTKDLIGFIEGKIVYKHYADEAYILKYDEYFEYNLDTKRKYLSVADQDGDQECELNFEQIISGAKLSDDIAELIPSGYNEESAMLYIDRYRKPQIALQIMYNGAMDDFGDNLCKQVKLLLEKYSIEEIEAMADAIDYKDYKSNRSNHFKAEDLIGYMEGNIAYNHDDADDNKPHYEYNLDFRSKFLSGTPYDEEEHVLSFKHIKSGAKLSDDIAELGLGIINEIVHKISLLPDDEKKEIIDRVIAMMK